MPQDSDTTKPMDTDLEQVQQAALDKAAGDFSQNAIRIDLVNRLSLKYLTKEQDGQEVSAWLEHHYPMAVEACFAELHAHVFNHATKIMQNLEKAEDIAQECIRELLRTANPIQNPKAWLSRVAHNKAASLFESQHRDHRLLSEVAQVQELPPDPDADELWRQFTPEKVKQLLSRADFLLYRKLAEAPDLKTYAATKGISYQTAKEHRHRLKVNLRSAYLKEQGWRDSPVILSYQQLRSIKRFMAKLTATCASPLMIKNQKVKEAFADCQGIMTWDISMLDANSFKLTILIETTTLPTMVRLEIKMNRMNRISICECSRGILICTMPSADSHVLSLDKGRTKLDYAELLRLSAKATVYDQVHFDKMLTELKDQP